VAILPVGKADALPALPATCALHAVAADRPLALPREGESRRRRRPTSPVAHLERSAAGVPRCFYRSAAWRRAIANGDVTRAHRSRSAAILSREEQSLGRHEVCLPYCPEGVALVLAVVAAISGTLLVARTVVTSVQAGPARRAQRDWYLCRPWVRAVGGAGLRQDLASSPAGDQGSLNDSVGWRLKIETPVATQQTRRPKADGEEDRLSAVRGPSAWRAGRCRGPSAAPTPRRVPAGCGRSAAVSEVDRVRVPGENASLRSRIPAGPGCG